MTVIDDDAVDVLTVTCDTDAETITIAWPEDGAMEVFVEGPGPDYLTAVWNDVEGSLLEASTASLSGWGSFFPAGGELTVHVALDDGDNLYDHFDTFDCP